MFTKVTQTRFRVIQHGEFARTWMIQQREFAASERFNLQN